MFLCLIVVQTASTTSHMFEESKEGYISDNFKRDAMMFLEFNICLADSDMIPLDAFFEGRALCATANCRAVRCMLKTPGQRAIFEEVINDAGLEHLGNVRFIQRNTGKFKDLYARDPKYIVPGPKQPFK